MRFMALLPVKPSKDVSSYACIASYVNDFGHENVIVGLNEDDELGMKECRRFRVTVARAKVSDPFLICALWMCMAETAHKKGADIVALFGDDVKLHNIASLIREIKKLRADGYKCIAIKESNHPSWPTFQALDARSFVTNMRDLFYTFFVNQDADPFVFEYYRRLGQATWTRAIHVTNIHGGVRGGLNTCKPPRYKPIHVEWKQLLPSLTVNTVLTIDILVPMHRVNIVFIKKLLHLNSDHTFDHRICVCIDNFLYDDTRRKLVELESQHPEILRIRVNATNIGASETRNRLFSESHSDYCIFLDDDVLPHPDLLLEYARAFRKHPCAAGFVGLSEHPRDERFWTDGIHANSLYFWHIATNQPDGPVPWGVTANLAVRWNDRVKFDPRFPKSGGGEDVDFCLRIDGYFMPVPKAIIVHPWRNSAWQMYRRMFQWAVGDSMLNEKYGSRMTFRTLPSLPELLIFWVVISPGTIWIPVMAETMTYYFTEFALHPMIHGQRSHPMFANMFIGRQIIVLFFGCIARNASFMGQAYGHLSRRAPAHLTTRFDWFFGENPKFRWFEQIRALIFVSVTIVLVTIKCPSVIF
jgi:GT2 family glycosyltransferase